MKTNAFKRALIHTSRHLKDAEKRHARILEATERNSVIAGLPPFTLEIREQLQRNLTDLSTRLGGPETAE